MNQDERNLDNENTLNEIPSAEAIENQAEPLILDEAEAMKQVKGTKPAYGHVKRFAYAITNPTKAFEDVDAAPRVLIPLIVLALLGSLITFLNLDFLMETQRAALITSYQAQGLPIPADGFESMLKAITTYTIGAAGITMAVSILIKGVVTHLLAGFFGSDGTAKKVISGIAYAYMIVIVGSLLGSLIAKVAGLSYLTFSPAMIMGADQIGTPLYTIMSAFDIFSIWYLGASAVAVRVIEKISMPKAIFCVALPYVLSIGVSVFTASM
ncbi:YIP1 family protein [Fusibacter paucivorans]|uniref:YIP1 family protein n=1 Tax=Fusibacter paucivorans TaxID=76009 RepID=A0ABS5PQ58_9FIRM|nr:Yip1 family protein [Fusibacter paucivorans]MBS7527310.1 YIP1 family protein [Fusibacter paucivorans]